MIPAEQVRKLTDAKLTYSYKRSIYELNNIQMLLLVRAATSCTSLLYTVYKNQLSMKEFLELLKSVKSKLVEKGYSVTRIDESSKDYYIFKISWEEVDALSNLEEGVITEGV